MADKITPKPKSLPTIGIRRLDGITFELIGVKDGVEKSILKETFGIVSARAGDIIQQMAEGTYHG